MLVAVLLRHDEADAKKHLARWLIRKHEVVGKLEVFDNAPVEEVDDFSGLFHVAGEAVRRPDDDSVVFSTDDAVQHLPELRTLVR